MLEKERARAGVALKRKARAAGKTLGDIMKRVGRAFINKRLNCEPSKPKPLDQEVVRAWNRLLGEFFRQGLDTKEAQRLANARFGFPPTWSPGQGAPR